MTEKVNYNAFVDHDERTPKQSLKIDNSKSKFAKQPKPSHADFEKSVQTKISADNEIKAKIVDSTKKYWASIKDQKLTENKDSIEAAAEKDVVQTLSSLALDLNNDESKPEGIGSVGLNQLLLQVCLHQRDQINSLAYRVQQLEKLLKNR